MIKKESLSSLFGRLNIIDRMFRSTMPREDRPTTFRSLSTSRGRKPPTSESLLRAGRDTTASRGDREATPRESPTPQEVGQAVHQGPSRASRDSPPSRGPSRASRDSPPSRRGRQTTSRPSAGAENERSLVGGKRVFWRY